MQKSNSTTSLNVLTHGAFSYLCFAFLLLAIVFIIGNSAFAQEFQRLDDSPVPPIHVPSEPQADMPRPGVPMEDGIQSSDELGREPGDMSLPVPDYLRGGPDFWTSPQGMVPTLPIMLLLTV